MWKVDIHSQHGDTAIYWVDAETAEQATTIALAQAEGTIAAANPATVFASQPAPHQEQEWPRPRIIDGIRVHEFTGTGTGYDQTQYRPDVHNGDVLWVPAERVAGFLMQAWPTAVTVVCGQFHALTDPDDLVIDGHDYSASAAVARGLIGARPWTVTIAGPERHDGERPYDWVVAADTPAQAAEAAMAAHLACLEEDPGSDPSRPDQFGEPTYQILATVAGLPGCGAGAYNDARPGAAESGEHDCLAVEDLRHRVAAWVGHTDTHEAVGTPMAAALAAEAALIVRHLAAVFDRGLA